MVPAARNQSRKNFLDHFTMHVGQAEVTATVIEREFFMVKPKQMQQSGMPVVHVNLFMNRMMTEFVSFAV